MKRSLIAAVAVCMLLAASSATAHPGASGPNGHRVIPVLVRVDSHGKVIDVSPAYRVSTELRTLIRKSIQKMITKPAMQHGHPTSSQFVMNMSLDTEKGKDGSYSAHLGYVSTKTLPSGQWHWARTQDHRLALADSSAANPEPAIRFNPMPRQSMEHPTSPVEH